MWSDVFFLSNSLLHTRLGKFFHTWARGRRKSRRRVRMEHLGLWRTAPRAGSASRGPGQRTRQRTSPGQPAWSRKGGLVDPDHVSNHINRYPVVVFNPNALSKPAPNPAGSRYCCTDSTELPCVIRSFQVPSYFQNSPS